MPRGSPTSTQSLLGKTPALAMRSSATSSSLPADTCKTDRQVMSATTTCTATIKERRHSSEQHSSKHTSASSSPVSSPTPTSTTTSTDHTPSSSPRLRSSSPPHPPTNNQQKRLGFERKTKIYLIPPLSEYTDDEIGASWVGEEDNLMMQAELKETFILYRQNNGSIPKGRKHDLTTRGIEYLCKQAAMDQRRITRQTHSDAVLDEQEDQWDQHATASDQEQAIQRVASTHSEQSSNEAIARAAQDEVFVRRLNKHHMLRSA